MTAIQAYILAKKIAEEAASGISGITYENDQLIFQLTNGNSVQVSVPMPKDGVSVTSLKIEEDHLYCVLSDESEIDAGVITPGGGVVQSSTFTALPQPGDTKNIYITTDNDNVYYWTGESYKQLTSSSTGTIQWKTF